MVFVRSEARVFILLAAVFGIVGAKAESLSTRADRPKTFLDALVDVPQHADAVRGRTFVPAYSSVMAGGGRSQVNFSVSLSIQNASDTVPLVIERIDYFDNAGRIVEKCLTRQIAVKPYGAIQITVTQDDIRGGLGANFVVDWSSPNPVDEPIIEAVMISSVGTLGYSFVSVGRRVSRP